MKYSCFLLFLLFITSCAEGPSGESLYIGQCAGCHGKEGEGLGQLIPPLADSDFIRKNNIRLSCIIIHGLEGPIVVNGVTYNSSMPGVPKLKNADLVNLINYIHKRWYNDKPMTTIPIVSDELAECK